MGQSYIPACVPNTFAPSPTPAVVMSGLNDLFELSSGMGMAPGGYVAAKSVRKDREQPHCLALGCEKSVASSLRQIILSSTVP